MHSSGFLCQGNLLDCMTWFLAIIAFLQFAMLHLPLFPYTSFNIEFTHSNWYIPLNPFANFFITVIRFAKELTALFRWQVQSQDCTSLSLFWLQLPVMHSSSTLFGFRSKYNFITTEMTKKTSSWYHEAAANLWQETDPKSYVDWSENI